MADALADTSIFIANEAGRPIAEVPSGDVRIAAATLTELRIGVLLAPDATLRRQRTATLQVALRLLPLPHDEQVAEELAELIAALRRAGRRVNLFDAIFAATAAAHGLAVWTQDDDFTVIAGVHGRPAVVQA